jgi:hypothetical protein
MGTRHSSEHRHDALRWPARRSRAQGPSHATWNPRPTERPVAEQLVGADAQQTLLLEQLRRAAGAPVSYRRLNDAGVEYPASVVTELELAGMPLERAYDGSRLLGVRLDPRGQPRAVGEVPAAEERSNLVPVEGTGHLLDALDHAVAALAALAGRARLWLEPRSDAAVRNAGVRLPTPSARWLAPSAVLLIAALVATFVVSDLGGARRSVVTAHPRSRTRRAATAVVPSRVPSPQQSRATSPTQVSPALAAALEARGHGLLTSGQLQEAIPILERAVRATGETLEGCLEPVSETCLTYAYALYDLGRALRLDRQPTAAVPLLERRLQIANQRPAVQAELELAREQAARPVRGASSAR